VLQNEETSLYMVDYYSENFLFNLQAELQKASPSGKDLLWEFRVDLTF